jgi:hypothetical protein
MKKLIMLVVVMAITVGSTFVPSNKSSQAKGDVWFEFVRAYKSMDGGKAKCPISRGSCDY